MTTETVTEKVVVFKTLKEAIAYDPQQKSRMYRVKQQRGAVASAVVVVATSPSAAALAVIGDDNVELVSPKEKYDAAMEALMEARSAGAGS